MTNARQGIDENEGELRFVPAPQRRVGVAFQQYLLTPVGMPFEWIAMSVAIPFWSGAPMTLTMRPVACSKCVG